MGYPKDADYLLRAYAPVNQGGHLLIETWHRGESSKDIELLVMQHRRKRGEVGRIELVDCHQYITVEV